MKSIINDVVEHGITSSTLDAYLAKLGTTLDSAYNAAENGQELSAMSLLGTAKVHYEHVAAIWAKMNEKTKIVKKQ